MWDVGGERTELDKLNVGKQNRASLYNFKEWVTTGGGKRNDK